MAVVAASARDHSNSIPQEKSFDNEELVPKVDPANVRWTSPCEWTVGASLFGWCGKLGEFGDIVGAIRTTSDYNLQQNALC